MTTLADSIAYAIRHGEPAQRDFDATCPDEDTLRRAVELAWGGEYDYAEEERNVVGWDVWGWTDDTPQNEQEWRLFVRRA